MKTQIRARGVTSSAENVTALACTTRGEEDLRTDGIPRTLCSANQFESDPVVAVLYDIPEERWRRIHIIQDNIDAAIVEKVPKSRAPCGYYVGQAASRGRRNFLKLGPIEIAEQLWPLGPGCAPVALVHRRVNVAIRHKNVQEPIVIKVYKPSPPREEGDRGASQSCPKGDVREIVVAIICVERLVVVRECGDKEVHSTVAIVISHGYSHGRLRQSLICQSEAGQITHIFKSAVVKIAIEIPRHGIVGHGQIHPAIVIHVHKHRGQTVIALRVGDAALLAHICERAITIVVEQMIAFSRQTAGPARYRHAAKLT